MRAFHAGAHSLHAVSFAGCLARLRFQGERLWDLNSRLYRILDSKILRLVCGRTAGICASRVPNPQTRKLDILSHMSIVCVPHFMRLDYAVIIPSYYAGYGRTADIGTSRIDTWPTEEGLRA